MNTMPAMDPGYQLNTRPDLKPQDTASPGKEQFASLLNNEHAKTVSNSSHKEEVPSDDAVKPEEGLNDDTPACNHCATDVKSTGHDTGENEDVEDTGDIEELNEDGEHAEDETGQDNGLKLGALLFKLLNDYMTDIGGSSNPVLNSGETSEASGGPVSENGLKAGTLIDALTSRNEAGVEDGEKGTILNSEKGLKVGSLLNDLISSYAAEIEAEADVSPEGNPETVPAGAESGEAGKEVPAENGMKVGEFLDILAEYSPEKEVKNGAGVEVVASPDKAASAEQAIEINTEPVDPGTADLIIEEERPAQAVIKSPALKQGEGLSSEGDAVEPVVSENKGGLNSGLMSGHSDQPDHEAGQREHLFDSVKVIYNSKNDAEVNNLNPLSTSNTSSEFARSIQETNPVHAAKTPGFQELLDNVVYVIKGNSKMGVTVEHESLGKLNISLSMEKGMVNVHINTSDRVVRELLENNIQQIVDTLNKDGVSVGEFSVALKGHRDNETNHFSSGRGKGKDVQHETKREQQGRGLVNIFA